MESCSHTRDIFISTGNFNESTSKVYTDVLEEDICQTGYIFALFGKEIPTPIENAPKPYTKEMFVDFWRDKRFLRVLVMWIVLNFFFGSIIN